jgi:hypothetical protein
MRACSADFDDRIGEAAHGYDAVFVVDIGLEPDLTPISIAYHGVPPAAKLIALIEHLARVFGDPPYWDVGLRLPNTES